MKSAQKVWGLPFTDRPVLDFEVNAGRLEVLPVEPGGTPRVESKRHGAPLKVELEGDTVKVRLEGNWEPAVDLGGGVIEEALSTFLRGGYGGEFTLYLPPEVKARLQANMGQARVQGLYGCDLEIVTHAGQVELMDCRGRFALSAKAGQIVGKALGGTFKVESGAGEAVLQIVQLDAGEHVVRSTMGAVKIDLAPGLDVRIESRTVMGSTRTRYPSNAAAKAVLKLEAELGAVKVREGEPYVDLKHGDWPDWRKRWLEKPAAAVAVREGDELRRILEMVQDKKLTAEEAERLISAL